MFKGYSFGPIESGGQIAATFNFPYEGTCTIKVMTFDSYGWNSDWANLEISVPKNKSINTMSYFLRFFENHPYLFPMLRQL